MKKKKKGQNKNQQRQLAQNQQAKELTQSKIQQEVKEVKVYPIQPKPQEITLWQRIKNFMSTQVAQVVGVGDTEGATYDDSGDTKAEVGQEE